MEEERIIIKIEPLDTDLSDPLKVEPPDSPNRSDEPPDELAVKQECAMSPNRVIKVEIEIVPATTSESLADVLPLPVRASVQIVQNDKASTTRDRPAPKETAPNTRAKPAHVCGICNERFFKKAHLDVHASIHSGKTPHRCEVCAKTFIQKSNLNRHMLIHAKMPHRCEVCTKTFVQKSNLNRHMLLHSGQRPYRCDVCSTSFFEKGHLKTHMFTHSSQRPRPYHCHLCPRSFFQRGHLDTHLLTHSGVKPHVCNICDKSFSKKTNLNRHRSIHR